MFESRIIEINGTFVGTIILEEDRQTRRFYATHESVQSLHNKRYPSGQDLRTLVIRKFKTTSAQYNIGVS
ncbi:hypothetical protein [Acetobacter syzygii]|uniref:Uncharacterized protein n=1 Tax=Acetobacter syzygii TaxID=146476 RepID=A0A270B813_9PROT|nr:hypothetical protein [Acetobacter syzygii]PAL21139.1 hypothetical protein B9K05_11480 [Acetobacter syzygii]PAL23741.1 hypothetical protein B9K04_11445 [Acetobacter syzygii]